MRIILDINYRYVGLRFCCTDMGSAIIRHEIFALPHTDHYPMFCIGLKSSVRKSDFEYVIIKHCPFCGAELICENA